MPGFPVRTYATGTTQFGSRIGKAVELGARLVGSSFTAHCTVEANVIVGQNMRKGVGCWTPLAKKPWETDRLRSCRSTAWRAIVALAFNYPLPARRVRGRIDNQNILIITPMRFTKLNYCQYLLSSHINYTLTNLSVPCRNNQSRPHQSVSETRKINASVIMGECSATDWSSYWRLFNLWWYSFRQKIWWRYWVDETAI